MLFGEAVDTCSNRVDECYNLTFDKLTYFVIQKDSEINSSIINFSFNLITTSKNRSRRILSHVNNEPSIKFNAEY
jgi:hypothetical protein